MKEKNYDVVVIGGGAAGLSAVYAIAKENFKIAIVEREERLGGILNQCIHNGFGLHYFKEELTGPEFALRFIKDIKKFENIDYYLQTTVTNIEVENNYKILSCYSKLHGVLRFSSKAVVLAMGCRERNRGNIGTPGSRPAGVYTAGLAQRLINIDGYIPGNEFVIVGSGDIGLIMARRLTWSGCKVKAVIEIQPYPSGLTRNIVQCLHDFNIPLYLSHVVSKIYGKDRVTGVDVTPLENGKYIEEKTFHIECDTLLLSVGLIPENELSKKCGVLINPDTNGPFVDAYQMTNIDGIFSCGNVLHVHDLVDYVAYEGIKTGESVCKYLKGELKGKKQFPVYAGSNIRYVCPNKFDPLVDNNFYMRSMVVKNGANLEIKLNGNIIKTIKLNHVQPSEMINVKIKSEDLITVLNNYNYDENNLEFRLE
ncbi:MAG: NAD(P)/FAD-dependent oxidoreductase [Spirochaetes bacterium]|nr:NAD(P)/FAD-dependent oxidoreductase [Spirochaetota bacterium]